MLLTLTEPSEMPRLHLITFSTRTKSKQYHSVISKLVLYKEAKANNVLNHSLNRLQIKMFKVFGI